MMKGSSMQNLYDFLEEAVVLAKAGAMCLLLDRQLVRPGIRKIQSRCTVRVRKQFYKWRVNGVEKRFQSVVLMASMYSLREYMYDDLNAEMKAEREKLAISGL